MRQALSVISAVIGWIVLQSITGTDLSSTLILLSALASRVGGCHQQTSINGGVTETKGRWQNGGTRDIPLSQLSASL